MLAFDYKNYAKNIVDHSRAGALGIERHDFLHFESPERSVNQGFVLIGKMVENGEPKMDSERRERVKGYLFLTAFVIPRNHTVIIPGTEKNILLHEIVYLMGNWHIASFSETLKHFKTFILLTSH